MGLADPGWHLTWVHGAKQVLGEQAESQVCVQPLRCPVVPQGGSQRHGVHGLHAFPSLRLE